MAMTTYQRNRSQPSVAVPEYDNLEIRCTWSGEYEEVSNTRISLEVKCVPNTQLQLLSLCRRGITFEESFLERLPQTEDDTNNQDDTDAPESPLFGFSPLARDVRRDVELFDDSPTHVPKSEPTFGGNDKVPAASESTQNDLKTHDPGDTLESSIAFIPTARPRSTSLDSDAESFTRSRKRSAADAELPDSGSEMENAGSGVLKDISNRKVRQVSRVEPASPGDRATESSLLDSPDLTRREIASPRSPKKPSPRKSGPTKIPGLIIANENASPRSPNKSTIAGASVKGKLKSPEKSLSKGDQDANPSFIPKPASNVHPESSESLAVTRFANTAVGFHLTNRGALGERPPTADSPKAKSIKETRVRFQIPIDATTATERSDGHLSSPSPTKQLGAAFERMSARSSAIRGETKLRYIPGNLEKFHHDQGSYHVEQPKLSNEPEVDIVNGLVILRNSERVHPATFKVTITAALSIRKPKDHEWSDLVIPGIPRTRGDRIGVLLFLMPARHGLEIRTTNVNRATIVENCLIAEFANTGNLVIPLRRCSRKSCGEISDFTVEQEIISHNIVSTAAASGQSEQSFIQMRCHAACSIKLSNRCLWSETCIVPLHVDGGPSGFFYCDVTSQKGDMKTICINARKGTKIGVSRIRVICSLKDIDKIYLRWALEFPGRRAAYWSPRIYPASSTSHQLNQHTLRYELLEVLNEPTYLSSGVEATQVTCDNDDEIARRNEDFGLVSDDSSEESESDPSQQGPLAGLSHIGQSIRSQLSPDLGYSLKQLLIGLLCLAFLRSGFFALSNLSLGDSLSWMQTSRQIPEQTKQISLVYPWETLSEDEGEDASDQDPSPDLNTLDMDNLVASDEHIEEAEVLVNDEEQDEQRFEVETEAEAEAEAEEHTKTLVSFRDRVDYWLGWTGPV
ncbi:uncharacterized protein DSM5745_04668 [Aspergillus mulundensis]|uniref:Uncharacterized protein n=1 Tax=Aspergillus mulundensis TaxID=1810919 RepID=A0A3D8S4S4_9EURO|nr:Uncharacterized protein DSM5745_04668 [Aspergillus mulundensis]RDW81111.1 Uncharacterized protein DSM5745_04668 [Aspergillus mulundensis]